MIMSFFKDKLQWIFAVVSLLSADRRVVRAEDLDGQDQRVRRNDS